jgi:hypothetical protein
MPLVDGSFGGSHLVIGLVTKVHLALTCPIMCMREGIPHQMWLCPLEDGGMRSITLETVSSGHPLRMIVGSSVGI